MVCLLWRSIGTALGLFFDLAGFSGLFPAQVDFTDGGSSFS